MGTGLLFTLTFIAFGVALFVAMAAHLFILDQREEDADA